MSLTDWPVDAGYAERRRFLRAGDLAVAMTVFGFVVAALVGLPLYDDGSRYLFTIATRHQPWVPNLRLAGTLPQLPAVMGFALGADLPLGRLLFTLSYGAVPVLSLLGCWWLVRKRAPALLLAIMPTFVAMQLNFSGVSELLSGVYLTWPLLLAMVLRGRARWVRAIAIAVGPLLVLLHPLAFLYCFGLAVVAAISAQRSVERGNQWRRIGWWLALCGLLRLGWTSLGLDSYERGRLTPTGATEYILANSPSQHMLILILSLATLLAMWLRHRGAGQGRGSQALAAVWTVAFACSIWIGGEFVLGVGITLKSAITLIVPAIGMLAVSVLLFRQPPSPQRVQPAMPSASVVLAGLTALTLLLGKSSAWWTGSRMLQNIVASSEHACLSFDGNQPYGLQWPWMRVVDAWSTPFTALATRPFVPNAAGTEAQPIALLLDGDGCERLQHTGLVHLPADTVELFSDVDAAFGPLRQPPR